MVGSEGLDRADPPLSASIIISVLLDHGEFNCNKMIPKMKLKKEPGFLWNTFLQHTLVPHFLFHGGYLILFHKLHKFISNACITAVLSIMFHV